MKNNLKEVRLARKMGQKELANAAQVSGPYIYDLERGNRNAKPETWARIAAALGCTVEELTAVEQESESDE